MNDEKVSAYFCPLGGNVPFFIRPSPPGCSCRLWKGPHEHEHTFVGSLVQPTSAYSVAFVYRNKGRSTLVTAPLYTVLHSITFRST